MAYRDYSTSNGFIVDPKGFGDFLTITAASNAAISGQSIYIRPGTYIENPPLKAGVTYNATSGNGYQPSVIIHGKCTFSSVGTVSLYGLCLRTNADYSLSVTGASDSIVNIVSCNLDCTDHTAIEYTSSSAASEINIYDSIGDTHTTGIAMFDSTTAGLLDIEGTDFFNSGSSITPSTHTGTGEINFRYVTKRIPISISNGVDHGIEFTNIDCSSTNSTGLVTSGTAAVTVLESSFASGTASAIDIGVGSQIGISESTVSSSNTNAITGLGTISYGSVTFNGPSSTINTTTQIRYITRPSFSTVNQVFTSSGTYTPTSGMAYCQIELVGGGGGSGGTAISSGAIAVSQSAGAGGYARKRCTASDIGVSQTVTIGAAGTAGTAGNNSGGTGGTSSVGALISGTGGSGGIGGASTAGDGIPGAAGGIGSNGDVNITGGSGGFGLGTFGSSFAFSGSGGSSYFGEGPSGINSTAVGRAGIEYGTGASGSASFDIGVAQAGAAGANGIVLIQEYILS